MKKTFRGVLAGLLLVPALALGVSVVTPAPSYAQIDSGVDATGVDRTSGFGDKDSVAQNVINLLLWIVGVASVLMLIWGGIRYITSGGNSNHVTAAKNTILYAVIGLAVALLAGVIVNFVINWGNTGDF